MIREKLFWRGVALGFILPVFAFFLYSTLSMDSDFIALYYKLWAMEIHTHVISLCVLINIIPFFIFLKLKREIPAQGVLMSTIFFALFVMLSKLL